MTALLQPGFDRVVRSALLGLQFRDAVDGRVVGEGLEVQIQDLWQPRRHQMLTANRSGIFALHAFAGLPIHANGELCGMLGLANRQGGYSDDLPHLLDAFLAAWDAPAAP